MAENHFITRYCISRIGENKSDMLGIDELVNLFSHTLQETFYDFLMKYFIKKENICKIALEEQSKKIKNFFKIVELTKEENNIIYGKIIFSDFDEVLKSLIVEQEGNIKASDMKFVPQRTFFFMIKFIKIREILNKEMNVGILLLHKRGTHSVKASFSDILSKMNKNIKLNIDAITFKDEFEELEKAEVKEISIIERDVMSDFSDKDILDLKIKKIDKYQKLRLGKGVFGATKCVKKIYNFARQKKEAPFYFNIEKSAIDVIVKNKNGDSRVITYTGEQSKQKIASILLDNNKVYKEKELDWDFIREEFKKEINNCEKRMDVVNWDE